MASKSAAPRAADVEWDELVEALTNMQPVDLAGRPLKEVKLELAGWCPAELTEQWRIEKNVSLVHALVLDYDDVGIEEWEAAKAALEGVAWFYHSSFSHRPEDGKLRYRAVVRLDRPVPREDWRRFFAAITAELGCAPRAKDLWKCSDPCRFFFGPFYPSETAPETGVHEGEPLPVDAVLALAASQKTPEKPAELSVRPVRREEIEHVIPTYVRKIANANVRRGWEAIVAALAHEPYAPEGDRDNTLLQVSGILARAFPTSTPEAIVAPLAAGLDMDFEAGARPPGAKRDSDVLVAKIARDQSNIQSDLAEEDRRKLEQAGRSEPYSPAEVSRWVREYQLPDADALARQLIVVHGGDHYLFWEGKYVALGGRERAEATILARLQAATDALPVSLGEQTEKGYKVKKIDQVVREYGRTVLRVQKDLKLQRSVVTGDLFQYAVCPRDGQLRARKHAGVDHWLRSWGSEALLDWLATAPKLEKATAALVLDGNTGTGKSMLAEGLARVWGNESPTPMHDLQRAFNDHLRRCPVVLADESVPWEYRRDTGLLKSLITSTKHQLREKFQATADLVGSVRLIISRNDHRLFEAGEALTQSTVNALQERLLYVHTGDARAPHFSAEEIAQHVLWLMQERQVASDDRLWVRGEPSRLHYRMRAYTSRVSSSCCQWLLRFVDRPQLCGDTALRQFKMDSQGLRVAPYLVYDKWDTYCSKERVTPSLTQVAEALTGIAERRGDYFVVDLNVLAEYADGVLHPYRTVEALQHEIEAAGARMSAKEKVN